MGFAIGRAKNLRYRIGHPPLGNGGSDARLRAAVKSPAAKAGNNIVIVIVESSIIIIIVAIQCEGCGEEATLATSPPLREM